MSMTLIDQYERDDYLNSSNKIEKTRDELLNCKVFYTLTEAIVLIEQWRKDCNQVRPHSS